MMSISKTNYLITWIGRIAAHPNGDGYRHGAEKLRTSLGKNKTSMTNRCLIRRDREEGNEVERKLTGYKGVNHCHRVSIADLVQRVRIQRKEGEFISTKVWRYESRKNFSRLCQCILYIRLVPCPGFLMIEEYKYILYIAIQILMGITFACSV